MTIYRCERCGHSYRYKYLLRQHTSDHFRRDTERAETIRVEMEEKAARVPVLEAEIRRLTAEAAGLRAAAQAFDESLSEWCDGPERDALRALLAQPDAAPAEGEGDDRAGRAIE